MTIEKPQRKYIKYTLSEISPKIKPKGNSSDKKIKIQSGSNKKIKGSQTIKMNKVSEIVKQFEANVDVDNEVAVCAKKEVVMDAFSALMRKKLPGDTLPRTPVRRKIKRLEKNITSKESILPWVTKSGHKGD